MNKMHVVTVYEKPTWSTCREVKRVLTARGVEFESVNYIDKPFSASELKDLLDRAGLKAQDALRRNEPAYKQLVAGKELSDDEVL